LSPLITDDTRAQLLENGAAASRGEHLDPMPVVKLFTPDAHATWLLTELDPTDGDTAFGLIDLGMGMPCLGHVRISELEGIRGPRDLAVTCDPHFRPRRRLSQYTHLAQVEGSIND
jgi:hypothetical protein